MLSGTWILKQNLQRAALEYGATARIVEYAKRMRCPALEQVELLAVALLCGVLWASRPGSLSA